MSPTETKSVPVSAITVKPGLPEASKDEPTRTYYMGTLPSCPVQNVTVGGICFHRFHGYADFKEDGKPDRELQMGKDERLTEKQVEQIRQSVKVRVVRWLGSDPEPGEDLDPKEFERRRQKRRAIIVPIDGKKTRMLPTDEPLARYLYMHDKSKMSAEDLGRFPPPSMEA